MGEKLGRKYQLFKMNAYQQYVRVLVPGGCGDVCVGVPGYTVVGYPQYLKHIDA